MPIALLRIRVAPRIRIQLSPYEIVYGRPFQCLKENIKDVHDLKIKELDTIRYVQSLDLTLTSILSL